MSRIGELEQRVSVVEQAVSSLPKKLWRHVGTLVFSGAIGLVALFWANNHAFMPELLSIKNDVGEIKGQAKGLSDNFSSNTQLITENKLLIESVEESVRSSIEASKRTENSVILWGEKLNDLVNKLNQE